MPDAQAYNDLVNLCNRFEKKLHDLELTRMVSVQMGPQTRLLQNNDTQMIEKDPVLPGEHHPPVEEPDGAGPAWSTAVRPLPPRTPSPR